MTDPQTIARGLTKAQRACFLTSTDVGCVAPSKSTASALVRLNVARYHRPPRSYTLNWTPLGLAVRDVLVREGGV